MYPASAIGPPKPNVPSRRKYSSSSLIVQGRVSAAVWPGTTGLAAGSVARFTPAVGSAISAGHCRELRLAIQLSQVRLTHDTCAL